MSTTLGQLVEFVLAHNSKGFSNWKEKDIAAGILLASKEGRMVYCCDDKGQPCGIVVFVPDSVRKLLHISNILLTKRWVMKGFLEEFKKRYAGYTMTAHRKNEKFVVYDTNKLIRRLS